MAETSVVVIDDYHEGAGQWSFAGDSGVTFTLAASAARAGTALGNTGGGRTLGYTFSVPAGKSDVSLRCALPAAVDVSAASFMCLDLFLEPGLAANVTALSWQVVTATGISSGAPPSQQYDGNWAYFRQPLTAFTLGSGTALDWRHVTGVNLTLRVPAGTAGVLEIDTLRACSYVYADDDYRYDGRQAGAPTNASIETMAATVEQYLFGSSSGIGPATASGGYELDPAQPNFGALIGWNQWTGQRAEVALDNESDHTFNTGLLLVGLCQLYRMTSDQRYLTWAGWLVANYAQRWSVSAQTPGAAAGSLGYMPYGVTRSGTRLSQTSTDQYLGLTWGLLEYFIVTGRTNAPVKQLLSDFQTWWNSADHVAYSGALHANQGSKDPLTDAAVAFVDTGDCSSVDTTLTTLLSGSDYQAGSYPYQTSWVGTGSSTFSQYSTLVFALHLLRCRLRRSKLTFPLTNLVTILQQNILFQFGFGQYYATDLGTLGSGFGKRPLGWLPMEGLTWNGTTKTLQVSAAGPADALDMSGSQWLCYLGPLLLEQGGDITGLLAAGATASPAQSALSVATAVLGLASKNGIATAANPPAGAIPRAELGPWQIYHNAIYGSLTSRKGILIDEQPNHTWLAGYAWWRLFNAYTGLYPSGAYDRVLDWQWQPGTLTLRLVANGAVGDAVSIPISGMQGGHSYVCRNLTTGAQHTASAGASTLTWTLAQPEETWLVYDTVQPPAKVLRSGAGTPRTVFASEVRG
ncbi:MAG TPA: hypothetical protein VGP33_01780 [Chloroflexota bacterium]|nr:hypothetical protein [Chloroflexota bacterium]